MVSSKHVFIATLLINCLWPDLACENSDRYLCRMCGLSLGDSGTFFDIISPFSLSQKNETVHDHIGQKTILSDTLIQKVENPAGMKFDVVTMRVSTCKGIGKWTSEATWFPGYSWKACICRQCGHHLGWMFELDSLVGESQPTQPSKTGFYAIIRENLLTETVKMDLTEDQAQFLAECEEEFAARFTEKDNQYMELKNRPLSEPPIVKQWDNPRNQSDRYNQRGGHSNYYNRDNRHRRGDHNRHRDRNHEDMYKDRPRSDRHRYEPY